MLPSGSLKQVTLTLPSAPATTTCGGHVEDTRLTTLPAYPPPE